MVRAVEGVVEGEAGFPGEDLCQVLRAEARVKVEDPRGSGQDGTAGRGM